jgi:WD40 repeat protein/Flp pilus assembly protein TadD
MPVHSVHVNLLEDSMSGDTPVNERDIFLAALDFTDAAERLAYLEKVCAGNPVLKRHLEGMLQLCQELGTFLESPAVNVVGTVDPLQVGRIPLDPELLSRLRQGQAQGGERSVSELCRDHPELIPAIDQCVHALRQVQQMPGANTEPATLAAAAAGSDGATRQGGAAAEGSSLGIRTVAGYEILGELGRGGMGVVYRARQIKLGRVVALKMILAGGHAGAAELERFRTEAEAIARLQHPNIVQIHEVGEQAGLPYFSLEFCGAGTLAHKLAGTPLKPAEAVALIESLAKAMHVAHAKGVLHRDLKPANVLFAEDGTPKITDFGLAKKLDEAGKTATGAVMGTPSYMAPEQAGGKGKEIGPACDIYALGAILYECLTGRPPFKAATSLDTILQVVTEDPVPPRQLNTKIPRDLETLCLKCLQKDPRKRYASAAGFADDLARYQRGQPILARPVGRLERTWRWCRRYPAVAALLVVACVFGASMAYLFVAAQVARNESESRRRALETEKKQTTDLVYATRVNLAYREWQDGNTGRVQELLEACPRELRGWEWDFLSGLCEDQALILRGHAGLLTAVALSPDGNRAVTLAIDGTTRVWDARSGVELHNLQVQGRHVAISPNSRRFALAGTSGVQLYDLASGRKVADPIRNDTGVIGLAYVRQGAEIALATRAGEVLWLDAASGDEHSRSNGRFDFEKPDAGSFPATRAVVFSADGRWVAQERWDGKARVWNAASGALYLETSGHLQHPGQIALSPDGRLLATQGSEGDIRLWDMPTKQLLRTLKGHKGAVRIAMFSADSKRLVSGSRDLTLRVWDVATGSVVQTLRGHASEVHGVAFGGADQVASASPDGTARVWMIDTRAIHGEDLRAYYRKEQLSEPAGTAGQETLMLFGHGKFTCTLAFSPDGRLAATAALFDALPHQVIIWDLAERRELLRLPMTRDRLHRAAFSPDGKQLAVGTGGGQNNQPAALDLFDVAKGQRLWHWDGPPCIDLQPAFAPGGAQLAATLTTQPDGNFLVSWEAHKGTERFRQGIGGPHTRASFSPDGQAIVTGAIATGHLEVYDAALGKLQRDWQVTSRSLSDVVCGPDGVVAVATTDGASAPIQLWGLADQTERRALEGHTGRVMSLAFSPDGTRLLSGGSDFAVRLWHTGSGQELLTLRDAADVIMTVAWSADGRRIGAAGQDGPVRVWSASAAGAAPRTDDWSVLYRDDFGTDGPPERWKRKDASSWEIRGGALRGTQATRTRNGRTFASALARLADVELPRTVEVRFAYRALRPLIMGAILYDPHGERSYTPMLVGGPQPFGTPCAFTIHGTEGAKFVPLGLIKHPFTMQPGRWREVRVLREPQRLRMVVDGAELYADRIPDVELTGLGLQGAWGAVGEEIEFKDLEIRAPADAVHDQKLRSRVRQLHEQVLLPAEVQRRLSEDPTLTAADRQLVDRLTKRMIEDPVALAEASRKVVIRPDAAAEDYELALAQAEAAHRIEPENPAFAGTLARAQYRVGKFAEAIATMQRALEGTRIRRGAGYPYQYAVLAIAHHRLGHADSARAEMGRLRDLLLSDAWTGDKRAEASLAEAEKALGDAARPANTEEDAIKRLVVRSNQDGWIRHDRAAYLAAYADDARERFGRTEKPDRDDIILDRRQMEEVRRLDFQSPTPPGVSSSYEDLHAEVRGNEGTVRGRVVTQFGPEAYSNFGFACRLRRTAPGWRIVETRAWLLAERAAGRRTVKDAMFWAARDADVDKLAKSEDLAARIEALRGALRLNEAYALANRATDATPTDAALWVSRGSCAHDVGSVADARAAFRRALELDPDVALPWYMSRLRRVFRGHGGVVLGVDFHRDGRRVFSGGQDKLGRLWDATTGKEISQFAGSEGAIYCAALSPDGRMAAAGSTAVRLWDVETGREMHRCEGHTAIVHRLAFSSDGTRLVTASADQTARVWDVATGQSLLTLKGHSDSVLGAVFSHDGRFIATASHDRTAKLWDAATGAEIRTLTGHTDVLKRVVFSPDDRYLVTTGGDKTTRFWDATTGVEVKKLQGHDALIEVVLYSPDGRLLATADVAGVIRVWDSATGAKRYLLRDHPGAIYALSFRPDSRVLAVAGDDGMTIWDVAPE